jgi:2-phosphosulfolactate phosphatase
MNVKVVMLPDLLDRGEARRSAVVVFDVLRATTTMIYALQAGVQEIRFFGTTDEAREAWRRFDGSKLLAGERDCVAPPGFDMGNSPRECTSERCSGRVMFMSTTNGTKALLAARDAGALLVGALVNAGATAGHLLSLRRDVLLLCAGTRGEVAREDLLGAGCLLAAMRVLSPVELGNDSASMALDLFEQDCGSLSQRLSETSGGRHVAEAGLSEDFALVARIDATDIVASVHNGRVVREPRAV